MEIEEAIRIITIQINRLPEKFEESCQSLLEEIRSMSKPLSVERAEPPSTRDYGIVYNRQKRLIRVDPIVFARILKDEHKETGIPYKELVWYFVEHERGHFELQELGLEPLLQNNWRYMTLYTRFEDYVISRFLRNNRYVQIEREILKSESKHTRTFNEVCVHALGVALGYVKLEKIGVENSILQHIRLISSKMKEIERPTEVPVLLKKLFPEVASENWDDILLKDFGKS